MKPFVLIILTFFAVSCATQKQKTAPTYSFNEITFGSGGGFTGAQKQFLLKNTGEVYKITGDTSALLNKITAPEIDSISKLIQHIDFKNITRNETGNITYHIEVRASDYTKKVTWTDKSSADDLKNLYKKLVKTIKK